MPRPNAPLGEALVDLEIKFAVSRGRKASACVTALEASRAAEEKRSGAFTEEAQAEVAAAAEKARLQLRRFLERQSAYDVKALLALVRAARLAAEARQALPSTKARIPTPLTRVVSPSAQLENSDLAEEKALLYGRAGRHE